MLKRCLKTGSGGAEVISDGRSFHRLQRTEEMPQRECQKAARADLSLCGVDLLTRCCTITRTIDQHRDGDLMNKRRCIISGMHSYIEPSSITLLLRGFSG